MPMINPDFSEEVDNSLPNGEYGVRVVNVEQKIGKTSGNAYLNWTLETFGEKSNGRKIFHSTPIGGKGVGILRQFLKVTGTTVQANGGFDTDETMGKELTVVIVTENDYPKVKAVKAWLSAA